MEIADEGTGLLGPLCCLMGRGGDANSPEVCDVLRLRQTLQLLFLMCQGYGQTVEWMGKDQQHHHLPVGRK